MSELRQGTGCYFYPSGAREVKELDMGSAMVKFTHGVTVMPGGSIVARFRDDGSVYTVCLEEPSALFGKIEIILPDSEYEILPHDPQISFEVTA